VSMGQIPKTPSRRTDFFAALSNLLHARGGDAPSHRFAAPLALFAALATIALAPASASAQVHQPKEVFGTAAQPSFVEADKMAVIPAGLPGAGDLLVADAGTQTISRFKPNGEPDPFAALGTNTIDGKGSGGCSFPPTPSAECDQTPQNGLAFETSFTTQIAVAPAGAAAGTEGNIYVTHRNFSSALFLIDIFAPDGHYLGQLTESSAGTFSRACGIAVDPAGAIYVGDFSQGIHKYVPSADPPVNADNSANFSEATTAITRPCGLAAGTQPLAGGGSEGFLFATDLNGKVAKLDSLSGAFKYTIREGKNTTVSVNAATGHLYVASNDKEFAAVGEVREYDASGTDEAVEVSQITTGPAPLPAGGDVFGVAVSPTGASSGDVYLATRNSTQIGVWGPAEKLAPVIEEGAVLAVGAEEATVTAKIGAEESPTTFHVQYIDEASFEEEGGFAGPNLQETADVPAGAKNPHIAFSETLPGLKQGTTYHWRFVATNTCTPAEGSCGTTVGEDLELRTPIEHPFELPDGRLWEMVSPSEKGNAEVATQSTPSIQHSFSVKPQQASPDGEAVTYASFTSFGEEAKGAPATTQFISRRGADGWGTENVNPTFEEGNLRDPFVGFSEDLSSAAAITFNPPLVPEAPAGFWNLYARENLSGEYEALTATEPQVGLGAPCLAFAGASQDFERVFFAAKSEALLEGNPVPAVGGGAPNLYEWSAEALNDLQALTVKASGGKYTLNFGSGGPGVSETGEIEATASAAEVQSALNALTNVSEGGGSVSVSGGPGNAGGTRPYLIAFDGGPLADTPQPPITATNVNLSGGSPASEVSLATLAKGHLALASVLPFGTAATPNTETSFGTAHSFAGGGGCNMEKALLRGAVSADGLRSFWTYNGSTTSPNATNPLFARLTDPVTGSSATVELDAKQGGSGSSGFGEYQAAARDGKKVFFTDVQKLTPNGKPGDLYRYDVEKREKGEPNPLQDITPHVGEPAEVLGVLGVSEKGDFAYFAASEALTATPNPSTGKSPEKGKANLYAWHEGEAAPHFIAAVPNALPDVQSWSTELNFQTARVSPDGHHLAFLTTASPTGYDNTDQNTGERDTEAYLYDFEDGDLVCASCNPSGARPIGPSTVPVWTTPYEQPRYLSDDGGRLFFETADALDPFYDTNGEEGCPEKGGAGGPICEDVYQFERAGYGECTTSSPTYSPASDGCISLISSGKSTDKSYLIDASVDGRDVFLSTRAPLVPQLDKDEVFDLYDARVGGSPPPLPPVECEGACHGAGTAAPAASPPGTHSFEGREEGPNHSQAAGCKKGFARKRGDCVKKHKHHKRAGKRAHRRANANWRRNR
jgi:hypothetical protein